MNPDPEGAFLQAQKLLALGRLSAGMAHELNSPLSYILSNLTMIGRYCDDLVRLVREGEKAMERIVAGEDPARVRADLARFSEEIEAEFVTGDVKAAVHDCREGALRVQEIVRNLREFSHPDDEELTPADLNGALESAVRISWNELRYRATVHRDYAEIPPLRCHPRRIEQAFMNLLLNAAQAIAERGHVYLSTRLEEADVVVRIRDTGCGIPDEHHAKLFEPFFTTKPIGKGAGLGLHVAYKIVKAHGGEIRIASRPGSGTEVTVRLPLKTEVPADTEGIPAGHASSRPDPR